MYKKIKKKRINLLMKKKWKWSQLRKELGSRQHSRDVGVNCCPGGDGRKNSYKSLTHLATEKERPGIELTKGQQGRGTANHSLKQLSLGVRGKPRGVFVLFYCSFLLCGLSPNRGQGESTSFLELLGVVSFWSGGVVIHFGDSGKSMGERQGRPISSCVLIQLVHIVPLQRRSLREASTLEQ